MTVAFIGTFQARLDWSYPNTSEVGDAGTSQYKDFLRLLGEFTSSGTGNNQCNRMFLDRRTLSLATTTDDLDLAGGLTDHYGNTLTFKGVKILLIHNRGVVTGDSDDDTATPTDGEDILIGGAGGNAWGSLFNGDQDAQLLLRSDGKLGLCVPRDGYSVSPGTEDILRIEHAGSAASGGDISYDIVIAGVQ